MQIFLAIVASLIFATVARGFELAPLVLAGAPTPTPREGALVVSPGPDAVTGLQRAVLFGGRTGAKTSAESVTQDAWVADVVSGGFFKLKT
jgi:hypothetical protein